jgi:mono/diheme cytochrome c family protein
LVTALALTGCGAAAKTSVSGSGSSGPETGKQIFASAGCVSCHTLAAAGATGTVGPNLDELKPSYSAVVTQVTNGGGGMPSFGHTLSQAQISSVAKFVSSATH